MAKRIYSIEEMKLYGMRKYGRLCKNIAGNQSVFCENNEETRKIQEFKTAGTKGLLECQIEGLILPLLADHVLREANHYIRILECGYEWREG